MEQDLRSQIEAVERSLPPLSPEKAELQRKASRELAQSGILERVLKSGDQAPDFTLPNAVGIPVTLSKALAHGPVVVSFYRGIW